MLSKRAWKQDHIERTYVGCACPYLGRPPAKPHCKLFRAYDRYAPALARGRHEALAVPVLVRIGSHHGDVQRRLHPRPCLACDMPRRRESPLQARGPSEDDRDAERSFHRPGHDCSRGMEHPWASKGTKRVLCATAAHKLVCQREPDDRMSKRIVI